MKIIIVGYRKVSSSLAGQLYMEGHETTLISGDAGVPGTITSSIDVMGMVGSRVVHKIQMRVGIEDTDLLITTINPNKFNTLRCLVAKKVDNYQTAARIRNPEYAEGIRYIREELSLSMVINPELAAAREMPRLLRFPLTVKIDTLAKGRVGILRFIILEHPVLHNMQVYEITSKLYCDVLVYAAERGEDVITPNSNFQIMGGDKVRSVASPVEFMKFFKEVRIVNNNIKTAMFVGGRRITHYLAKMFQDTPTQIRATEQNFGCCRTLSERLPNVMVIHGGGSNQQVLPEEGIQQTGAFASLTGFDEKNIISPPYTASQFRAKLITKVNRIVFENVIGSINLGSIIYPRLVTTDSVLQYVRVTQDSPGSNAGTPYKTMVNRTGTLKSRVEKDTPMIGTLLEKLFLKDNLPVVCINRNERIITPRGKDIIEEHDTVIIVTTNIGLSDLKDTLK